MHIVETKNGYKLMRYGGLHNGKNTEVRIGVVPVGTLASGIDSELMLDLTPRELQQLVEFLNVKTAEGIGKDCDGLAKKLSEIASAVGAGIVEAGSLDRIKIAATSFLKLVEPGLFAPVKPKRGAKSEPSPVADENAPYSVE